MRAAVWLLIIYAAISTMARGLTAEGDAELVVLPASAEQISPAPKKSETFSSFSNGPVITNNSRPLHHGPELIYQYRRPGQPAGQAAGFRVEINTAYQLRISVSFATHGGKHTDWAQMFDQPADRVAVDELIKWMLRKKLDVFDAVSASEKCARAGKSDFAATAPNEFLSVRYPSCADPKMIYWRDLPNEARVFQSVGEVQALNTACSEIALLAAGACPEKSVLRVFLTRE